jgi:hypothetical protein
MAAPKIGILVDEAGVTSVALLAGDPPGRRVALRIYSAIQPALDAFSARARECLMRSTGPAVEGGTQASPPLDGTGALGPRGGQS